MTYSRFKLYDWQISLCDLRRWVDLYVLRDVSTEKMPFGMGLEGGGRFAHGDILDLE